MPTLKRHERQHYCRQCTVDFEPTPGHNPSSHMSYVLHYSIQHPVDRADRILDMAKCDKNCKGIEQSDETQHGVKLYGPGSARMSEVVPLKLIYEDIFPAGDN